MRHIPMPTITMVSGEDPDIRIPYAYIVNGPAYWTREDFERSVKPENRERFIFPVQPVKTNSAHVQETKTVEQKLSKLADGQYIVNGKTFTIREGWIVDDYGNTLFSAPYSVDDLEAEYQNWRENFDE